MTRPALIDAYDGVLFDLDGVIYLGPIAVPGAAEGIASLRGRGTKIGFVTNNAARPPQAVAEHLVEIGIDATAADVVTSAQAGAHLVLNRFGVGARVLLVGGEGVADAVSEAGMIGVRSADDDPVAVLQGYGFDLTCRELNEAAIAIQRGAYWVATNTDPTRPTDRGLVPGNGAGGRGGPADGGSRSGGGRQAVPAAAGRHRRAARGHPPAVRRRSAGHRHRRRGERRPGQHAGAQRLPRTTRSAARTAGRAPDLPR